MKKIIITEEQREYLRVHYRDSKTIGNKTNRAEIAKVLGLKESFVKKLAAYEGLTKHCLRDGDWTKEQTEYLHENVNRYPINEMAKRLHKSKLAVYAKMQRDGLHYMNNRDGWYTKGEVEVILGMSKSKVLAYMNRGELKFTYEQEPGEMSNPKYRINRKDLKKFILTHLLELTGRNVDLFQLVDIIMKNGLEYQGENNKEEID